MEPAALSNPLLSNRTRLRSDLALLLAAVVWGTGFAVQRIAAAHTGAFVFNGLRFLLGALVLLVFLRFRVQINKKDLVWVLVAGCLLYLGSALQQAGLSTTSAANAGFITGLYTILVPIILWIGWRKRLSSRVWMAAAIAVIGNLLLSLGGAFQPAPGDLLELAGALMWALHIIVITRKASQMDPVTFSFGQLLVAGVLNLVTSLAFERSTYVGLPPVIWVIVYSGLIPVGLGFTLQVIGQKNAPPSDAALILSLEAVFGALSGFLLLGEGLTLVQTGGCALIFGAILLSQYSQSP
jgi:drug/metabolite transporter (DMT)-like permease